MTVTRCLSCSGSGRMMGGGMIQVDCSVCHGTGKPNVEEKFVHTTKELKRMKPYKAARKRLKAQLPDAPEEEIERILDEEMDKLRDSAADDKVD